MMKKLILLGIISIILLTGKMAAQPTATDSLLNILKFAKEDTVKVNALHTLAWELEEINSDSSLALAAEALLLSEKLKWKEGKAESYYQLGYFNWQKGNLSASLENYQKNLAILLKLESAANAHLKPVYTNKKTRTMNSLGIVYQEQGDNPKALNLYFKALKIVEKAGDKIMISTLLTNIGVVYWEQGNLDKALKYYSRALEIDKELNNKELSITLGNIALIYHDQGDIKKALDYYNQAIKAAEETGNNNVIPVNLGNVGDIYEERGDHKKALEYYYRALELEEKSGNKTGIAYMLGKIGTHYASRKEYILAENFLKKALALNYEAGVLKEIVEDERCLSEVYARTGRERLALEHYKKYISARDSIYNEENTKKNITAELNYEFEKKEAIQKLEHEKAVVVFEAEKKSQAQLRIFLITAIILTLLILFFVNRAYRNKKKHAAFLAEEDSRKELLLEEVHHRINNNLQIISSLLSMQASSANDKKLEEYLQQSLGRIQSLAALHELLYDNNTSMEINMKDYVKKILDFHRNISSDMKTTVDIQISVHPVLLPPKTAVPIALIINELVTNSLKYAFSGIENGIISVSLSPEEEDEKWKLTVSDNGKGLPAEDQMRPNSLGLRLVKMMTRQIGTTFSYRNGPGATFDISFKIS